MRRVIAIAVSGALAIACGDASIGQDPGPSDIPLPDRQSSDSTSGDNGNTSSSSSSSSGSTTPTKHTLTVNINGGGAGTITSNPTGLTCSGTKCTGSFDDGATVTLTATPNSGTLFSSWSGGCTGATCAPVMKSDVTVGIELVALAGAWSGTYTNTRQFSGCTFNNNGTMTSNVATSGTSFTSDASMTAFEIRQIPGCGIVGSQPGAAPAATLTMDGATMKGTWSVAIKNANTLDFPFTATLAGNMLTGTWTCTGCTGGFTLTKP